MTIVGFIEGALFFFPPALCDEVKIASRRISARIYEAVREAIVCMRQGARLNIKYSRRYTPTHRRWFPAVKYLNAVSP